MANHAEGTFTLTSWDEATYEELADGAKLTRARITQDFHGALEATGGWDALMCYRADGTADYVGLQRLVGRLAGRSGSFVLETQGIFDGTQARTAWRVLPGSGTDELRGLRGEGSSAAPHGPNGTYALDYDIG